MNEKKETSLVHYFVVIAFCLLFRFVPGFAGITPMGMAILGTFIGAVYGWTVIGNFWPSIIALLGMGLTVGMNPMLASGFGNIVFFGLVFAMPVIVVGVETGAFQWIVDRVLSSKVLQGRGFLTLWALMMVSFLVGKSNPIVMCLVLCSFVATICKQVGYEKNSRFAVFAVIGIALSLMMGQVLFPFSSGALTITTSYNTMFPQEPLEYLPYLCFIPPMGAIMVTIYVLLCKYVFRVDVSKLANFKVDDSNIVPMNSDQKKALGFFFGWLALIIASTLPLGPVAQFMAMFGLVGFTLVALAVMEMTKRKDGSKMLDVEKSMKAVPWGMVVMMAYIMCMSAYLNKPEAGITNAMAALISPLATLPPVVAVLMVLVVAVILTNFASNVVVIILVMPFMFNIASMIGLTPTGAVCLLIIMGQFALITPAASPITAIAMSSEMVDAPVVMKTALKVVPVLIVIALAIGWPLANIVF